MIIEGPNDSMPLKLDTGNPAQKVAEQQSQNANTPAIPRSDNSSDVQIKQAVDKATGLLQTIVSDNLSDQVIRKMPPDEYLHLLSLLDQMISGSVDNQV